jgi:pyruvate,orthophosphate dikinase
MTTFIEPSDGRLVLLGGPDRADHSPSNIGAKAAELARLADAGLPVPPAFVLSTQTCANYHRSGGDLDPDINVLLERGVAYLEQATGRCFGAARRPLLVSVRSGAPVSMPGMLETILNVGLSDATLSGLLLATGDPAFVWDTYRRLICTFAEVVEGLPPGPFEAATNAALNSHGAPDPAELDIAARRELVEALKRVYRSVTGHPFSQDPAQQLLAAVEGVMRSWNSDRAVQYRGIQNMSDLAGTAVTVQAMVFGNLAGTSGSGVGFTRNPATGHNELYVDFLLGAQGEDVVAGRGTFDDPDALVAAVPGLNQQLHTVCRRLEAIYHDAQEFEFTVEDGKLWLLQTRSAKRTPMAALQIACDLVEERLIDPITALGRLTSYDVDRITGTRLVAEPGGEPIGQATPASQPSRI